MKEISLTYWNLILHHVSIYLLAFIKFFFAVRWYYRLMIYIVVEKIDDIFNRIQPGEMFD